ncbi:MAG: WecB/TagA/CpsF family glycosyltransferase [Clostridiales bacterium]|nr:WecB/TagA/CpsF family glycosyltransferase [Clostridiales bacterium]
MPEKINIRGVGVDNVSLAEATAICDEFICGDKLRAVFTPNAEILQSCIERPELMELVNSADLVTPDGAGVVLASKILKTPLKCKTAGCELGIEVAKISAERGYRVFLMGGKPASEGAPSIADQAAEKLCERFPGLNVVGTNDGYFNKNSVENDAIIDKINAAAPDVLYVCFGVPAQEEWIAANRSRLTSVRLCLALGGSLDVYSGNVRRAPKFFIKTNLEWFYRLCCEPRRIGRMMKLPKFIFGTMFAKKSRNNQQ